MEPAESLPPATGAARRVLGAALALAAGLLCAAPPLRDTDWGWHLATGRRILAEGAVPWTDAFMWTTEGVRAPPVFWGFDCLLALVDRAGGVPALLALQATLVGAVALGTWALLRLRGGGPLDAGVVVAAVSAAQALRLVLRPHLVSLLFLVATSALVLVARTRPRLLLAVPPAFLLWANVHPGVVLGLGLLATLIAGEALRLLAAPRLRGEPSPPGAATHVGRLAAVGALAAAASLCTPAGWELYPWLWEHRAMFSEQAVTELRPFDPTRAPDRFAALVALVLCLRARASAVASDPTPWLGAAFFAALTVGTSRFFVDTLTLLAVASAGPPDLQPRARAARALVVVVAAVGLWDEVRARAGGVTLLHPAFHAPGAAEFLATHATPDPIYNSNRLGGDLVHRLQGRRRLFWDGRQPLYRHLVGLDFDALDARFRFGTLVIAERDPPLSFELPGAESRFRLVHFDDQARVYVDGEDPAWRGRELRGVRFEWTRTGPQTIDLWVVIDPSDPGGALAELRRRAERPGGYYVQVGIAVAERLRGDEDAARRAARSALELRDGSQARALVR